MISSIANDLLDLKLTVPIGSLPLGVETSGSDLDLCVLLSEIPHNLLTRIKEQGNYHHSGPNNEYDDSLLLIHSILYEFKGMDIFIFNDPDKLAIVHKVMFLLEQYPKFVLRIKWVRVAMFRYLLEREGFLDA